MASTHQFTQRDKVLGGMSSLPAHLIGSEKWSKAFNVRFDRARCVQLPRKVIMNTLSTHSGYDILALLSLPSGVRDSVSLMALSQRLGYRVNYTTDWEVMPGITPFTLPSRYYRWATTSFAGRHYFTNPENPIRFSSGSIIEQHGEEEQPCGKYMGVFYDHLILCNAGFQGNVNPNRIMWSGLSRLGSWIPTRGNEADYYDCLEGGANDPGLGITGAGPLTNLWITHTRSVVYITRYVGLPSVMVTEPLYCGGCDFEYGLVISSNCHYYPNLNTKNFYAFEGQMPQPIGNEIADFFFSDINQNHSLQQKTWGYADDDVNEVVWVYCSKASFGKFDKMVVYNTLTKSWSIGSAENLHCFLPATKTYRAVDQLSGEIGDLSGRIYNLGGIGKRFPKLWGSGNTMILREAESTDHNSSLLYQDTPVLETADFIYSDVSQMNEVDTLILHAKSNTKIRAQVSTRSQLSDPVVWQDVTQLWQGNEKEGRLSVPRKASRIFRFRFFPLAEGSIRSITLTTLGSGGVPQMDSGDPTIVQPPILSGEPSFFYNGDVQPAGSYKIEYLDGALVYSKFADAAFTTLATPEEWAWYVNYSNDTPDGPDSKYLIVLATGDINAPGLFTAYSSWLEASDASKGQYVTVTLASPGTIGIRFQDDPYWDNVGGPPPRFKITPL